MVTGGEESRVAGCGLKSMKIGSGLMQYITLLSNYCLVLTRSRGVRS